MDRGEWNINLNGGVCDVWGWKTFQSFDQISFIFKFVISEAILSPSKQDEVKLSISS